MEKSSYSSSRQIQESMTRHARQRMTARGLSEEAVQAVMECGRLIHVRGASIYVIGRKEVQRFTRRGINLAPYEGVQVVCASEGTILTVYRNRDFRGLRPRCKHPRAPVSNRVAA